MKTVRGTVFIGGTLAGGSPNKKPATKSPGSRAKRGEKPLPAGEGLGRGKDFRRGVIGENPFIKGSPLGFAERSEAKSPPFAILKDSPKKRGTPGRLKSQKITKKWGSRNSPKIFNF